MLLFWQSIGVCQALHGKGRRNHPEIFGRMVCNEDYAKKREREIEHEKAKGAAIYKGDGDKDARIAERQRKIREKKMENRVFRSSWERWDL